MQKTQDLVLARLENFITEGGLTPVKESAWANTGYVLALTEDLDVVTTIGYDFQNLYFSLKVYRGHKALNGAEPELYVSTINGKPTSEALAEVADYLAK